MMNNGLTGYWKDKLLAAGGVLAAIAASSCCVLPLVFAAIGISGVWIGMLTRLAPYQPVFLAIAVVCIGFGFWRAYGSNEAACAGRECGRIMSRRMTKTILWLAAMLVVIAGSAEWWVRLLA